MSGEERDPNLVEVYGVPLQERLPVISIPLRPADLDVLLDLQPSWSNATGTADTTTSTTQAEPDPSLKAADAKWADALLRELGRRVLAEVIGSPRSLTRRGGYQVQIRIGEEIRGERPGLPGNSGPS